MTDKRFIGYFAAGVLTAAALYGIYVWVHPRTGGDDEPIVVAGGSLDIGSINGFEKDLQDPKKANAKQKGRTISRVEILYNKTTGPGYQEFIVGKGGDIAVDIEYVPKDTSKPHDKVTFTTQNGGKELGITNDPKCLPVGDEVNSASTTIAHQPPDGTVGQITLSGNKLDHTPDASGYPCANGKCQVVLHYVCGNPGHC